MTTTRETGSARLRRHSILERGVALVLSWAFTATTVWASAPPLVGSRVASRRSPLGTWQVPADGAGSWTAPERGQAGVPAAVPDADPSLTVPGLLAAATTAAGGAGGGSWPWAPRPIQASVPVDTLASGRLGPMGLAVGPAGRIFFTDWRDGSVSEVLSERRVARRATGLVRPRGITWESGSRMLVVADGLWPGHPHHQRRGVLVRLDLATGGLSVVAEGLRRPRGVVRTADGTVYVTAGGLRQQGDPDDDDSEDQDDDRCEDDQDDVPAFPGVVARLAPGAAAFTTLAEGFKRPVGVVVEPDGSLLVTADRYHRGGTRLRGSVFRVSPAGAVSVKVSEPLWRSWGLVRDAAGNLYVSGRRGGGPERGVVVKVTPSGAVETFASGFGWPRGLALTEDGDLLAADAGRGLVVRFRAPSACATFFGPERLVRLSGPPTVYDRTIARPAWVGPPHRLRVTNGEEDGRHRVSSAWITVGGTEVASPSDFSPKVAGFEREVSLPGTETPMRVKLASQPGSFLTVSVCGTPADATPPQVEVAEPGQATSDTTPRLVVRYRDEVGAGEPAASGVDLGTLSVVLDGTEVTELFTKGPVEATAELTEALAAGDHVLAASIRDLAGNEGQVAFPFRVEVSRPTVEVYEPVAGAWLRTPTPTVKVRYSDDAGVDLATLRVLVDGLDRTGLFSVGPAEAVGTLPAVSGLVTVEARISDLAGNPAVPHVVSFRVDTAAPDLTVSEPASSSRHGSAFVEVSLQYSDDQGIDVSSLDVRLDGTGVVLVAGPNAALGVLGPLADGPHSLTAAIADQAGNPSPLRAVPFTVDTAVPFVQVVLPVPGSSLRQGPADVLVVYSDEQGVDLASLSVKVDGVERVSDLVVGPESATGALAFADGAHTVAATISDQAGNPATSSSSFAMDTVPPTGLLQEPQGVVGTATPAIRFTYEDGTGTGVDPDTVRAYLDGTELVAGVSADAEGVWIAPPPLGEGQRSVEVAFADRAGNPGQAAGGFVVDTVRPTASVMAPEGFTNDATPDLVLGYDGTGSAVRAVRLYLARTDVPGEETEVTPWLGTVGETQATGVVPEAAALVDGTWQLRLVVEDAAGHASEPVVSAFVVDTVAPVVTVADPADGSYVPTATPSIRVCFEDERSGFGEAPVSLSVDGNDLTGALTVAGSCATGSVPADSPLPDGAHALLAAAVDRAGNASAPASPTFTVDTVPPTVSIEEPAEGAVGTTSTPVRVAYSDPPQATVGHVQVFVVLPDGTREDRTGEFTVGEAEATATLALGDGAYRIQAEVLDWAGHPASAERVVSVDTQPPVLTITSPAAGTPTNAGSIPVTGTVTDVTAVELRHGTTVVPVVDGQFQLEAPLSGEGDVTIALTATDAAGHATSASVTVLRDTTPPAAGIESPLPNSFVGQSQVALAATFGDGEGSGVDPASLSLRLDNVDRGGDFAVTGDRATASLTLGDGPHSFQLGLRDLAGNPASAVSEFRVDTGAPVLLPGETPDYVATLENGVLRITGTVQDLDPGVSVTCRVGETTVEATVSDGTFGCDVPLGEGANEIEVTATDGAGHSTSWRDNVTLDMVPPGLAITEPAEGAYTSAATVDVRGDVTDSSPVAVRVQGVAASVQGTSFLATAVPVGDGPEAVLQAVAEDAAGNQTTRTRTLHVDRTAPVVEITSPQPGAVVAVALVDVTGTVSDAAPALVYVNDLPAEVGQPGPDGKRPFSARVALSEGQGTVTATARDAANNVGTAEVQVTVDSTPPVIVVGEPAAGLVTNAATVRVAGTVTDATAETLTVGAQTVPVVDGAFSVDYPLASEGGQAIVLTATDAADNTATVDVPVVVDRTPPTLSIASPSPGAAIGQSPVTVLGFVQDATDTAVTVDGVPATRTQTAWQASVDLPDGPATLTAEAVDAAGNRTTATVNVTVDLGPPAIDITAPPDGTLTRDGSITVTGTASARSALTVTVNTVPASLVDGTFTATVSLAEGDNDITAVATSAVGRTASDSVRVTRDSTVPVVVLDAPERISRGKAAQAVASASDNLALAQVVIRMDGTVLGTFTAPPFVVTLTVPEGAQSGDTLTVVAEATDQAGNTASASRGVRVAADGAVVGQALDDSTSLPLGGATVTFLNASGVSVTTDERGRYSLPTGEATAVLRLEKAGMTAVDRDVVVESGVGTVPVDARLTPLAEESTLTDAGTLSAGVLSLQAPAGTYQLTALSPQGLPALLPLGWSPLLAFDLRGSTQALPGTVTGLPALTAHLVGYASDVRQWRLLEANLAPVDGTLSFGVPGNGSFALVVADPGDPPIAVPNPGEPLEGVAFAAIPPAVQTASAVTPPLLPPGGGTARGRLAVMSPTVLPSGTVVQAQVTETFTLASGEVASEEQRLEDLVLFNAPVLDGLTIPEGAPTNRLYAKLPITPSRSFETTELASGKVHLDILAGREGVRGKTGGNEAVTLDAGDVRLSVGAHSLPDDVAIDLQTWTISDYAVLGSGLTALAEATVDFSGRTLSTAAELSVASDSVTEADAFLIAKVERIDGIPRLAVVALGQYVAGRIVSKPYPGLPGISEGGRYVVYKTAAPVGFVAGTVRSGNPAVGVKAVLTADGLPFIGVSKTDGSYILAAATGSGRTVSATVTGTSLVATGTANVSASETTTLDLTLAGAVTTATVSPENAAVGVLRSTQIDVTTTAAIKPTTVTADNIKLAKVVAGPNPGDPDQLVDVAVRFVLSLSGKNLAVIPLSQLEAATTYTFTASGLVDVYGALVNVPPSTFTTKADVAPTVDIEKLVFSMPDQNGIVTLTAPAGTLPSGSEILIINAGNGVVVSFSTDPDGGISKARAATFPATINDHLFVSITFPDGNVRSFERSKYVAEDGTTAIGSGGGTVNGLAGSGLEMRIPEHALTQGVTFTLEAFPLESLSERKRQLPSLGTTQDGQPRGHFGAGVKISSAQKPTFAGEVDLAFPLPEGLPEDPTKAFFYVVRRLEGPDGKYGFEVIDHAFIEGQGDKRKVVTASYPFAGFRNSFGNFGLSPMGHLFATSSVENVCFLMWTHDDTLPGAPIPGVVTGKVRRLKWSPGAEVPEYLAEPNATVFTGAEQLSFNEDGMLESTMVATSQADGTYTLWDNGYIGGPVQVTALSRATEAPVAKPEEALTVMGFEANPADWETSGLRFYRNVATGNVTFPALQPPPPPPAIAIALLNKATGQEVGGITTLGTALQIEARAQNARVMGLTVNGVSCAMTLQPDTATVDLESDLCKPTGVGAYTVTATALSVLGGAAVTSSRSFLFVASGGGNNDPVAGPPVVISVSPKPSARGVPLDVLPQVAFSEPVKVGGRVSFIEGDIASGAAGNPIAVTVIGTSPTAGVVDLGTNPQVPVTSITIKPLVGLRYGTTYNVVIETGAEDLDTPTPSVLEAYGSSFSTFTPASLPPASGTASPGIVVLGDRAYLVQNNFYTGVLKVFDVRDPAAPRPVESASNESLTGGRPVDIAGDWGDGSVVAEGGRLVAVATSTSYQSRPSNIEIFDVSSATSTTWLGGMSLTASGEEGIVQRLVVRGGLAYAATYRKGIQVVDLGLVKDQWAGPIDRGDAIRRLNTAGQGQGQDAILQTIQVLDEQGEAETVADLKVGEFVVREGGQPTSQRLVVATGWPMSGTPTQSGLIVANPQLGTLLFKGAVSSVPAGASLRGGYNVALGRASDRDVAAVVGLVAVGSGAATLTLAIIDLSDPVRPVLWGYLPLSGEQALATALGQGTFDVIVAGDLVLVSGIQQVALFSLADPARPRFSGVIDGVGGRLALGEDGLLFSTARSAFGAGGDPMSGIHVATLGPAIPLLSVNPQYVLINQLARTQNALTFGYRIVPDIGDVQAARIELRNEEGTLLFTSAVPVAAEGAFVWPKDQELTATPRKVVFEARNPDGLVSPGFTAGAVSGSVLPPELEKVLPGRKEVGSNECELTVKGRNFSQGARVELSVPEEAPLALVTRFVSTSELKATVPAAAMSKRTTWAVAVASGPLDSNSLPFKVVPAGLAPSPVLVSVEPGQLMAGSAGTWVVLHGHFVKDLHQVYLSAMGSPLVSIYYSPGELRALVPEGLLRRSGRLTVSVASIEDVDLVSDGRVLEVVDEAANAGLAMPSSGKTTSSDESPQPKIARLDPPDVPYIPAGTNQTRDVRLFGDGFAPGAQVFARIDGGEPRPLPTEYISPGELRATLTKEEWGTHEIRASLVLDSTTGPRETVKIVRRERPTITVRRNKHPRNPDRGLAAPVQFLEPSRFYDPSASPGSLWPWLLESGGFYAGRPVSYGLDENPLGFEVEVSDVSKPTFYTQDVTLRVETSGTGVVGDAIERPLMTSYQDEATRFRSARIGVVMDAIDDGSVPGFYSSGAPPHYGRFSEGDDTPRDQTIQGSLEGYLKVIYANHGDGKQVDLVEQVEICPETLRRKIYINPILLSNVECSPQVSQPCFTTAEIQQFVDHAREIWAQACVEVEAKPVRTITNAPEALVRPEIQERSWSIPSPVTDAVERHHVYVFPEALRRELDLDNQASAKAPHEINVYFVRELPNIGGAAMGFDDRNLVSQLPIVGPPAPGDDAAMNSLGYPYTNTIFITTTKAPNGQRQVNARTLPHEFVHVVLHRVDSEVGGDASLTLSPTVPPDSIMRKRFCDDDIRVIRDPGNPVVCHWSQCP